MIIMAMAIISAVIVYTLIELKNYVDDQDRQ